MCCGAHAWGLTFIHNRELFEELERMVDEDNHVRSELAAAGELTGEYHPRLETVHRYNAARLKEIIAEYGWPGRSLVGNEGATYAWLILEHAISDPDFQRRGLELLKSAASRGEVPATHAAYLEDRIRTFEGRPQLYGTQFDRDRSGEISPLPIEDPEHVNDRRRALGMDSLEQRTRYMRSQARNERENPRPFDYDAHQQEFNEWAHRVGWRR